MKKAVIAGAGFGGLNAAKGLRKAPVEVTILDRRNHHVFQPLLYQVATAELSPAMIAAPTRHILRKQQNARVLMPTVKGIDLKRRVVLAEEVSVSYDFLLVATGAQHSYFGHDAWERLAPGLKSLEDATRS